MYGMGDGQGKELVPTFPYPEPEKDILVQIAEIKVQLENIKTNQVP